MTLSRPKAKSIQIATGEVKVYIPAQYDEKEPACLMVFTDGLKYANRDGVQKFPT